MSREEPGVITALCDLAREYAIKGVVQVGAEDAAEAIAICKSAWARGLAIEADTRCKPAEDLVVTYVNALVGATNASHVAFYEHCTSGLSGKLPRDDRAETEIIMRQRRLDSIINRLKFPCDMLIIDTEGTTLDVLRGATGILAKVRVIYAEVQTHMLRPGISLLPDVDTFLKKRGFSMRKGPPSYDAGGQGNYTWVRK